MAETLKIVIPMAGWGTRMRPHTWSKPKSLVSVAGKSALEHLMDGFETLPDPKYTEYVFIVGPYLGETQIPKFIAENYPDINAHFVVQAEMKGQSHALYLARQYLTGPTLMIFADTLIDADFSFLEREKSSVVAWVKPVPDPRRFGVAEVGKDGWVRRFIEKPESMENNLAVVGCYYFKRGEDLMAAIEEQFNRDVQFKNEFFLTHSISIMIEHGALVRTETVDTWLDTGTIDATLETNKILLSKLEAEPAGREGVEIREPVFIHDTARVENSVIGPNASIGAGCQISGSAIEDSIIESDCEIKNAALTRSFIGVGARVQGRGAGEGPISLNVGDNSDVRC